MLRIPWADAAQALTVNSKQEREFMNFYESKFADEEAQSQPQWKQMISMDDSIPKKRKEKTVNNMKAPIPKKARWQMKGAPPLANGPIPTDGLKSSNPTGTKEYAVVFDAKLALGFYCVTMSDSGKSYCKIISVCPYGDTMRDTRIQPGAVVVSAGISDQEQRPVWSSVDLKDCYNDAQQGGLAITITFSNIHVEKVLVRNAPSFSTKQWSRVGQWIGECTWGWDGGASSAPTQSTETTEPSMASTTKDSRACKSTVQFAVVVKCRTYCVSDPAFMVSKMVEEQFPIKAITKPKESSVERNTHILSNHADGTLRYIDPIVNNGSPSKSSTLETITADLKRHRDRVAHDVSVGGSESQAKKLQLTDSVLSLRLEAAKLLSEVTEFRSWKRLEFRVVSIQGADTMAQALHSGSKLSAKILMVQECGDVDLLQQLPVVQLTGNVQFERDTRPYHVDFNAHRACYKTMMFRMSTSSSTLCFQTDVSVPFADLVDLCRREGHGFHDYSVESDGISVRLSVHRVDHHFEEKRKDLLKRLHQVMNKIDELNRDVVAWNRECGGNMESLGVDEVFYQGKTLLHGAVSVVDPSSLKKLLAKGKGKVEPVILMSVRTLAKKLLECDPQRIQDLVRRNKRKTSLGDMIHWLSSAIKKASERDNQEPPKGMSSSAKERLVMEVTDSPEAHKPVLEGPLHVYTLL